MADRPRRPASRRGLLAPALAVLGLASLAVTVAAAGRPAPTSGPARVIGCTATGGSLRQAGPNERREIALTFDDGPSSLTSAFMDVLERRRVPATYFVIGNLVGGQERLLRRALAHGNAIGNHSFTHPNLALGGLVELRQAQAAVAQATGYTPCVFRAPMNKHSPLLVAQARSLGLNTVQWSVDSRDWRSPGPQAIYARVLAAARPGAIVLMHDGRGRPQDTLTALPRVIASLRARGYRFVTVPRLLGLSPRYGAPAPA